MEIVKVPTVGLVQVLCSAAGRATDASQILALQNGEVHRHDVLPVGDAGRDALVTVGDGFVSAYLPDRPERPARNAAPPPPRLFEDEEAVPGYRLVDHCQCDAQGPVRRFRIDAGDAARIVAQLRRSTASLEIDESGRIVVADGSSRMGLRSRLA